MTGFLMLPILIPTAVSLFIFGSSLENRKNLSALSAVASGLTTLTLVVLALTVQGESFHLMSVNNLVALHFRGDGFAFTFACLASFLWILTSVYAGAYMKKEKHIKSFFAFFLMTEGVVMGVALAGNLFTLYMFYEILTLTTFPLVIHARTKEALKSGKKYIGYSLLGATFILLGMMLIFGHTQSLEFVPGGLTGKLSNMPPVQLTGAVLSLFFGFGVKAALVPLHSWLPSAMIAPTPVSALLHAVAVVKSGIFSIVRTVFFVLGATTLSKVGAMDWLLGVILVSIVFGSFTALHQVNLKKRLAYSTISQLGYILFGVVFLNPEALMGSMIHLINHALIKIVLFFCVGAIAFMTGKKYIHEIGGIGRKMPVTMLCFSIAAFSLIGIPPSNGFVSKWFLGLGAMEAGKTLNIIILLVSAFLTAGYLLPIVVGAFFTKTAEDMVEEQQLDPPKAMLIPIVVITGLVVFMGIFPNWVLSYLEEAIRVLF